MKNYNGWTNWDTWNANLHMTNDECNFHYLQKCQSPCEVADLFGEFFPESVDGIDTDKVNWREIFNSIEE
jgi:hypothetical protein